MVILYVHMYGVPGHEFVMIRLCSEWSSSSTDRQCILHTEWLPPIFFFISSFRRGCVIALVSLENNKYSIEKDAKHSSCMVFVRVTWI